MITRPTVSVVIPTYNEEAHLARTLESIGRQTYRGIVEVLVADGQSTDETRMIARRFSSVEVVDNPGRIQSAGLNCALARVRGDIVVRVDGHCVLADDYIERCVEALAETGAAMVGGGMTPTPTEKGGASVQRGIAAAMASRVGAGPARFHVGGPAGWVDTVYLGAYRAADARAIGGYAEDVGVNEDAEFAMRMRRRGGIWYDPEIRSTYVPRASYRALTKQFFRYGRSRVQTLQRHPDQVKLRQLAAPALVLGLLSTRRRPVAATYGALVLARASYELGRDPEGAAALAVALPVMHLSWGVGFLYGLLTPSTSRNFTPMNECQRLREPWR